MEAAAIDVVDHIRLLKIKLFNTIDPHMFAPPM